MAYLLDKRGSALPAPKKKRGLTMVILLPSSVKVAMAYAIIFYMVIFCPSSVESYGGDHGIYSREEEVCPSGSKRERSLTIREEVVMAYLLEKRESGFLVLRGKGV